MKALPPIPSPPMAMAELASPVIVPLLTIETTSAGPVLSTAGFLGAVWSVIVLELVSVSPFPSTTPVVLGAALLTLTPSAGVLPSVTSASGVRTVVSVRIARQDGRSNVVIDAPKIGTTPVDRAKP